MGSLQRYQHAWGGLRCCGNMDFVPMAQKDGAISPGDRGRNKLGNMVEDDAERLVRHQHFEDSVVKPFPGSLPFEFVSPLANGILQFPLTAQMATIARTEEHGHRDSDDRKDTYYPQAGCDHGVRIDLRTSIGGCGAEL